jgi:hypothetical protein
MTLDLLVRQLVRASEILVPELVPDSTELLKLLRTPSL